MYRTPEVWLSIHRVVVRTGAETAPPFRLGRCYAGKIGLPGFPWRVRHDDEGQSQPRREKLKLAQGRPGCPRRLTSRLAIRGSIISVVEVHPQYRCPSVGRYPTTGESDQHTVLRLRNAGAADSR